MPTPATPADVQAQVQAALDAAKAEDTVIDSVIALVNTQNATVAGLQTQLAAAIAASNPVAIQAASDGLAALVTETTAKTAQLAAAVVTGTGTPVVPPTVPVVAPTP